MYHEDTRRSAEATGRERGSWCVVQDQMDCMNVTDEEEVEDEDDWTYLTHSTTSSDVSVGSRIAPDEDSEEEEDKDRHGDAHAPVVLQDPATSPIPAVARAASPVVADGTTSQAWWRWQPVLKPPVIASGGPDETGDEAKAGDEDETGGEAKSEDNGKDHEKGEAKLEEKDKVENKGEREKGRARTGAAAGAGAGAGDEAEAEAEAEAESQPGGKPSSIPSNTVPSRFLLAQREQVHQRFVERRRLALAHHGPGQGQGEEQRRHHGMDRTKYTYAQFLSKNTLSSPSGCVEKGENGGAPASSSASRVAREKRKKLPPLDLSFTMVGVAPAPPRKQQCHGHETAAAPAPAPAPTPPAVAVGTTTRTTTMTTTPSSRRHDRPSVTFAAPAAPAGDDAAPPPPPPSRRPRHPALAPVRSSTVVSSSDSHFLKPCGPECRHRHLHCFRGSHASSYSCHPLAAEPGNEAEEADPIPFLALDGGGGPWPPGPRSTPGGWQMPSW
ncbi:hypothetical protein F5Y17DRAFT_160450 [Xylariaceae sp. FL0594]|nr:hypothetical protein F5Y17DRAFT_160450 [Xylariaceae sp. FL0594]